MSETPSASRTAWLVVMLLIPVALLNYLDRQMLATIPFGIRWNRVRVQRRGRLRPAGARLDKIPSRLDENRPHTVAVACVPAPTLRPDP